MKSSGNVTANQYDHALVYDPAATKEIQGEATVLQVLDVAISPKDFYEVGSDHLPIMVVLRSSVDDD